MKPVVYVRRDPVNKLQYMTIYFNNKKKFLLLFFITVTSALLIINNVFI